MYIIIININSYILVALIIHFCYCDEKNRQEKGSLWLDQNDNSATMKFYIILFSLSIQLLRCATLYLYNDTLHNNNNNNISLLQTHGPYTYKKKC